MGVLDEAIRQHLELKRQRGADAGEIKREEDEALGEVRVTRGPGTRSAAPEPEAEADASPSEEHDSTVHQPTEAFDPEEVAEALGKMPDETIGEQPEPELETVQQPVAEPQHQAEPDPPEPEEDAATVTDDDPVAEPAQAEPDAEEHAEAAGGDAADELEETPEFLEDAPEHDKLWFEQKPPKDFDF